MRIAVLLYGQPRFFRETARSIVEEFSFDGHEVDFFCHFWNEIGWRGESRDKGDGTNIILDPKELSEQVNNAYSPVCVEIEETTELRKLAKSLANISQKIRDSNQCELQDIKFLPSPHDVIFLEMCERNFFDDLGQYCSIEKVIGLKKEHEIKNDFKYDIVIRTRTDLVFAGAELYDNREDYISDKENYYIKPIEKYKLSEDEKGVIFGHDIFYLDGVPHSIFCDYEQIYLILNNIKSKKDTFELHTNVHSDESEPMIKTDFGHLQKIHFKDWLFYSDSESSDICWSNIVSVYLSAFFEDLFRYVRGKKLSSHKGMSGEIITGCSLIYNRLSAKEIGLTRRHHIVRNKDFNKKASIVEYVVATNHEDMITQIKEIRDEW